MAAFNDDVTCPPHEWTLLTLGGDCDAARIQNKGVSGLELQATVGNVKPTQRGGAEYLPSLKTIPADMTLSAIWPGISGANRVWAWNPGPSKITASVSHA